MYWWWMLHPGKAGNEAAVMHATTLATEPSQPRVINEHAPAMTPLPSKIQRRMPAAATWYAHGLTHEAVMYHGSMSRTDSAGCPYME